MSTTINKEFDARIKKVQRNHLRMARGYDAKVGRDGLIVFRPKRRRPSLPLRSLALLLVAFFAFKIFVLMQIGDLAYQARIDAMMDGSLPVQLGAYALQIDPLMRIVATQLAPFF
ncbi:hypothetical protein DC366_09025 [Pelagivirga sediminicola]|uniref:Uncharacterized protein n=1 Tax=Pelagivirga sediminicola TaxID=2170575 RepID=A0A2T7G7U8_9RHOB|nr:hypothetical protein [Pelagivirga sediminicola]PVA10502.1 hypothetical protein DC366_09025 [Pelagivirga sediminicola]